MSLQTAVAGTAELARKRALEYALSTPEEIPDPDDFANAYTAMIEDRAYELRYPDLADPTPEEFFYS